MLSTIFIQVHYHSYNTELIWRQLILICQLSIIIQHPHENMWLLYVKLRLDGQLSVEGLKQSPIGQYFILQKGIQELNHLYFATPF